MSRAGVSDIRTRVVEVVQRTPSVKSLRFAVSEPVDFQPGQFLRLTLEGDKALTKTLSISSSPTEEHYLEVTKRITASRFSGIIRDIEPGYEVEIKYPMGKFVYEERLRKIALLSGGIGITPLRSMCRYIVDRALGTDVFLLYSNRTEEEIAFRDELEDMERSTFNLKVIHTLSRANMSWQGRTGRIDSAMVEEEIPDYRERAFFVCGPPPMVEGITSMLARELAVPEEQIKRENFVGY